MDDPTEGFRRALLASGAPQRFLNETQEKWNTEQLREEFIVHRFLAPFVDVTRKSDGAEGTMMFTHSPRWYFGFEPKYGHVVKS